MGIEVARDIVIIIYGISMLVLIILIGVFGLLVYRQIKALTTSLKDTIQTVKEMGPDLKEALKSSRDICNIFMRRETKNEGPTSTGAGT